MATISKIALITGANKGIGAEIARQLGELGMTVLVAARDEGRGRAAAEELSADGIDARPVLLDVTEPDSVAAAAKQVERDHGRLDVLVNNAGIADRADGPGVGASLEVLHRTFATNVDGVVLVTNAMLPLLRKGSDARIVNVSSELAALALLGDPAGEHASLRLFAYTTSKAALNAVTVQFANELRADGIKVNAICPGYCATDMNDGQGVRTPAQGAAIAVRMATLPEDGPTGAFRNDAGPLPW